MESCVSVSFFSNIIIQEHTRNVSGEKVLPKGWLSERTKKSRKRLEYGKEKN